MFGQFWRVLVCTVQGHTAHLHMALVCRVRDDLNKVQRNIACAL